MASLIIGIVLIGIGLLGMVGALPFVHHAARHWPREITRGDAGDLVATNFLVRFVSLLLMLAGVALVVLWLI
jgi:hypothetical protein